MRVLALVLALPAASAFALQSAPASAPQEAAAAAIQKTVEQTASPELVGQLASELAITPGQAEGAAATMFGVAKTRLTAEDFAKVSTAVPNMDGLLKAAPAAAKSADSAAGKVSAALGGVSAMAGAATSLSKLGLKPETIVKVAPALVKIVQTKAGAQVGALLAGALK
jgi:uncharacterized protein VcgC/VcgE DUF2780